MSRVFYRSDFVIIALVAVLIGLIYQPILDAPFLAWDDEYNILNNPYFVMDRQWFRLWTHAYFGMFVPVISTVWYALFKLGGGGALLFHLFNLIFHLLNAYLIFRLALEFFRDQKLGRVHLRAGMVAALFAVHPLQVAAVAWISGGRDILATTLALLASLLFIRSRYILAACAFSLGLLSKPQIAAVPLAIFIYVLIYKRQRWPRSLRYLAPWFLLSLLAAGVTFTAQSAVVEQSAAVWERPRVILDSFGFYLSKLFWPRSLAADYGRTPDFLNHNGAWLNVSLAALFLLITLAAIRYSKNSVFKIGILWFALLLPVSGVVSFGYQYLSGVADHYCYLALAIPIAIAVASVRLNWVNTTCVILAIIGLAALSAMRVPVWTSNEAFFTDMIEQQPRSFAGQLNLGVIQCLRGQQTLVGLSHIELATEIRPHDPKALGSKALCLLSQQRFDDILALNSEFRHATLLARLDHDDVAAAGIFNALGGAHYGKGEFNKAAYFFCQATLRDPINFSYRNNLTLSEKNTGIKCGPKLDLHKILLNDGDAT